jgi:hypothetical protein
MGDSQTNAFAQVAMGDEWDIKFHHNRRSSTPRKIEFVQFYISGRVTHRYGEKSENNWINRVTKKCG